MRLPENIERRPDGTFVGYGRNRRWKLFAARDKHGRAYRWDAWDQEHRVVYGRTLADVAEAISATEGGGRLVEGQS